MLESASGGHLDSEATRRAFGELLQTFGVGAQTAAFQFYNHHLLTRPVRDELIASFARVD